MVVSYTSGGSNPILNYALIEASTFTFTGTCGVTAMTGGGGGGGGSTTATDVIAQETKARSSFALRTNRRMVSNARTRFEGRRSGRIGLPTRSFNLNADVIGRNGEILGNGAFSFISTGQGVDSFLYSDVQFRSEDDLTTGEANIRFVQERAVGAATNGYALGATYSRSNVSGTYTGTTTLRAANLSLFTVREIDGGAVIDAYVGVEMGVADTDLNDGSDDFSGSYDSRTFSAGVGYLRDVQVHNVTLRSYFTLDVASTQQGAFTLASPTTTNVSMPQQTTTLVSLRAQPEFRYTDIGPNSDLRLMPSVLCEYTAETGKADDTACGLGFAFDITSLMPTGGTLYIAAGVDQIGGVTNTSAQLGYEHRF